jgi:hypothetical protein
MSKVKKKISQNQDLVYNKLIGRYSNTTLLEVFVYKDRKTMQEAATSHPRWGGTLPYDIHACFSKGIRPRERKSIEASNGHYYDIIGAIFLNMQDLAYNNIMHECMHAALCYYHYHVKFVGLIGKGGPDEEAIVMCADEFFNNILKSLSASGVIVPTPKFTGDEQTCCEIEIDTNN